ncbi:hypothetical protein LSTR_LSTR014952 [Laodelphax striatellus]|uniref:Uncharacterized protein n=1 Tax=Laodelphax striatellus TaxID=195883 RepID=A0A482WL62_LAOST|nr:hypothetical protein LSTR_LSTR014952 [Laodelphax striatellus]
MNSNITQGGTFSSPFFPVQYSRDYNAEYVVTCEADASLNCRIRVVFSDFLLADMSIMEVAVLQSHPAMLVQGRAAMRNDHTISTKPVAVNDNSSK